MRFISVSIYCYFSLNPFESGCKSTKNFLCYNIFLEKNKKGKTKFDFAFFKSMIMKRLSDDLFFRDVSQGLNEEVPERLHAFNKQGFVGRVRVH